jgi:hypothetical protein
MHLMRRLAAAVFGLWFTLAVTEPVTLHACAMHDGAPAAATALAGEHANHHGGHAEHDAPADDSQGGGHACLCLGACSASAPLSVAARIEVPVAAVQAAPFAAPIAVASSAPRAAGARLLPWPNGPPTQSA